MVFIPFLVLILLITCCVAVFGSATLDGASQVSLLAASAVSVVVQAKLLHLDAESKEKKKNNKKDLYLDETINIMMDYIRIRKIPSGDLAENSNGEKK